MAQYLSAGVYGSEIDLSTSVPSVATGITVFGGEFTTGEAFRRIPVTTIEQLIQKFGTPTDENYNDWFQAYNFLKNGSELYLVRAVDASNKTLDNFDAYSSNKTYLKGEGAKFNNTNIVALQMTNTAPAVDGSNNFVPSAHWTAATGTDLPKSVPSTMNAGLEITPAGVGTFYSKYIPNSNSFELDMDDYVSSGITFLAKAPGTDGNKISVSFSKDISKGILKPVSTYWNGDPSNIGAIPVSWIQSSYNINTVVVHSFRLWKSLIDNNTSIPGYSADWVDVSQKAQDVVFYNGNNWVSSTSNNSDTPSDKSSKWYRQTNFDDLFEDVVSPDNKEIALVVFVNGEIAEKYIVSTVAGGKDADGNDNFIDNVLLSTSQYIYSKTKTDIAYASVPNLIQYVTFSGGTYTRPSVFNLEDAYNLFRNPEEFDISVIIANEKINLFCMDIAKERGDCFTIAGMPKSLVGNVDPVAHIIEYAAEEINVENSYASFYGNYIQIADTYNSKYRWVNIAGAIAGSQIRTNNNRDPWWANAGLERGQILNVTKIAFNPTKGERDMLYRNKINPIVSMPGQGNCIIWGQKTLLSRASAFNRINVRLLFLVIEKAVNKAMRFFVFEPNDEFTRAQAVAMVSPFLEEIKGRRGIYEYRVICDETINTPEVIDANVLKVNVLIKPTRTGEFVEIKYVATKTGADLVELGKTLS